MRHGKTDIVTGVECASGKKDAGVSTLQIAERGRVNGVGDGKNFTAGTIIMAAAILTTYPDSNSKRVGPFPGLSNRKAGFPPKLLVSTHPLRFARAEESEKSMINISS